MSRSILFVDTYYFSLLTALGLERTATADDRYDEALASALDFGFGTGGAYARNFESIGWDAQIVVPNSLTLQTLWAREHGIREPFAAGWKYGAHLARLPLARTVLHRMPHLHGVLLEQVKKLRPDVVYVQDINLLPPSMSREVRRHTGMLVGEIASPLPPKPFLTAYDLMISALPSVVDTARNWDIDAEGIPLGFDERWVNTTPASEREIDAIFVGSFSRLQPTTVPLLRAVADAVPGLRVYGPADPGAVEDAGLTANYGGPAWGREMFALLGQSKMVINRHGSVAGPYAVNMRMYETTGSGAALITESKSNLSDLFEPGSEVLAYNSIDEAAGLAAGLIADPARLDAVASAGQRRTLGSHTYAIRARQIADVLESRLASR